VYAAKLGFPVPIYLSAGAVIDRDCLKVEAALHPEVRIFVHPNAAIVTDEDKKAEESGSIAEVAGTRSGTGAALARKVMREYGAIAVNSLGRIAENVVIQEHRIKPDRNAYFMEVAQGFSLGINSQFYPKVTSRECTVMQGMADARLPPRSLAKTYMAIRTYPIRVGNVDGYTSGEWYIDQVETDWGALELPEERTTVTNRVRRVATFSPMQFFEAVRANDPDWVFVSHMDYLGQKAGDMLIQELNYYAKQLGLNYGIIVGCGPKVSDITTAKDIEGYGNNYRSANTGIDR
jgi:adenylosuccinate synthase